MITLEKTATSIPEMPEVFELLTKDDLSKMAKSAEDIKLANPGVEVYSSDNVIGLYSNCYSLPQLAQFVQNSGYIPKGHSTPEGKSIVRVSPDENLENLRKVTWFAKKYGYSSGLNTEEKNGIFLTTPKHSPDEEMILYQQSREFASKNGWEVRAGKSFGRNRFVVYFNFKNSGENTQ